MSIIASMTAAQISDAISADPSLKADGVKVLADRYLRQSAKGRKPRWKSVTKLAEYLGYEGASTREAISTFLDSKLSKPAAAPKAKAKAKAKVQLKAEPEQAAFAFTSDPSAALQALTSGQIKAVKMSLGILKNDEASPSRRKAATTTLRNYGLIA